jgi:hypothetical protein
MLASGLTISASAPPREVVSVEPGKLTFDR